MCLAIVGKVVEIKEENCIVDFGDLKKEVSIAFVKDKIKLEDWVMIHTGFVLEILNEEDAQNTIEAMNEAYHTAEIPES